MIDVVSEYKGSALMLDYDTILHPLFGACSEVDLDSVQSGIRWVKDKRYS